MLAQVVAKAFHNLPQSRWLIADPLSRREIMPGYFRILVDHAMANGAIYTDRERQSAALWLPIAPGYVQALADYDTRLAAACGQHLDRFRLFDEILDKHHPHDIAHHHLAVLAVTPAHQGEGIGSALLSSYNETLDRHGIPAYLEAAEPRSSALYVRHGYRQLTEPFHLPDGPPMWPMWRDPKRPSAVGGHR